MSLRRRGREGDSLGVRFDPSKVDLVTLSPNQDAACLYIVSDAPWTGSDAQINSLQQKIHNYVGFAADGQLASQYPDTAQLPWRIVVECRKGAPDTRTTQVLTELGDAVRRYGGDLVVETSP